MTGSGKSFTMMGSLLAGVDPNVRGIYTYSAHMIFDFINREKRRCVLNLEKWKVRRRENENEIIYLKEKKYIITASFVEIYNEQVKDLLYFTTYGSSLGNVKDKEGIVKGSEEKHVTPSVAWATPSAVTTTFSVMRGENSLWDNGPSLDIREDPVKYGIYIYIKFYFHCEQIYILYIYIYISMDRGVFIANVIEVVIHNVEQLNDLIKEGNTRRKMATTERNAVSSRSHAILILKIILKESYRLMNNNNNGGGGDGMDEDIDEGGVIMIDEMFKIGRAHV
jgi:hypothetical protein